MVQGKKNRWLLLFLLMSVFTSYSQGDQRFEVDILIDWSRMIENRDQYDSGLNLTAVLTLDRHALLNPTFRLEIFPNLNFNRFGVGPDYRFDLGLTNMEFAVGAEVGIITRKRPGLESYGNWWTYGANGTMRIFPSECWSIVVLYNVLRRPDFQLHGAEPGFVESLFVGMGYLF